MPAVLAATALLAIVGLVVCAFSTWVLFQKRTEFALRTLQGAYLPEIEQSLLDPQTKAAVREEIRELADQMQRGQYENWQSAGILQRLQRLPVLQWGQLQAVQAFVEAQGSPPQVAAAERQFSRLRRAVELGKATSFDFQKVLSPVYQSDDADPSGQRLIEPLTLPAATEVIEQAKRVADRAQVPDQDWEDIQLEQIVRREIQAGASAGGF